MFYLLDTNILIHIIRGKRKFFFDNYDLDNPSNQVIYSIVTIGELRSFALQRKWGQAKIQVMENLLLEFRAVDINATSIINRYAEIDTFSKGKLDGKPSLTSSRTMGKNDIWIAATASVVNATLLTTDQDFDHLHNEFIQLQKVDNQLIV
jgi:tRNA(fMet)-specific endonuclease VapC